MSTIVTRSGKGVPLTATDHDNNVNNLNTDKVETLADLSITSTATEINLLDGVTATTAELNYTDGVTSNIQTQLGTKLPLAGGTMTGTIAGFTSTGIDDNATSTAITIDASENVMVGTTSAGGSAGVTLHSSGYIQPRTNTGIPAIYADREGSDGSIVELRKDSTTVGSIGTSFGDFTIGGESGLRFRSDNSQYVIPYNVTDNTHTATVDLGTSDRNFKDLYLSGSVYLGGTAAANALDDYEEGTWTPTLNFLTAGDLSVAYSVQEGSYTKIGNLVEVHFEVTTSTFTHTTAAGQFFVAGLPFTAGDDSGTTVDMRGWTKANYTSTGLQAEINTSRLYGMASGSGQGVSSLSPTDIPNAVVVGFKASATYRV